VALEFSQNIKFLEKQINRLEKNLSRAKNLVNISEHLRNNPISKNSLDISDILRSATVFTHASLEDFLRAISEVFLPQSNEDTLNVVPLVGQKGRADKFLLGKLAQHRGKTVDCLIQESVVEYLLKTNYNNTIEITSLLQSFGINMLEIKTTFKDIGELMERRHQIVHRADKIDKNKNFHTNPISAKQVKKWIDAVDKFSVKVLAQCAILQMK